MKTKFRCIQCNFHPWLWIRKNMHHSFFIELFYKMKMDFFLFLSEGVKYVPTVIIIMCNVMSINITFPEKISQYPNAFSTSEYNNIADNCGAILFAQYLFTLPVFGKSLVEGVLPLTLTFTLLLMLSLPIFIVKWFSWENDIKS